MDLPGDQPAGVAETHLSVVVFIGDRAYKVKKPVDVGFVDLTTREARERICRAEVALNRRLAPDVYLGVVDMVRDGEVVDHLVEMRRMPAHRRLSTLVVDADPGTDAQLRAVARLLADFHSRAERSPVIDAAATPESLAALWEDEIAGLAPFAGEVVDGAVHERVASLARRYVAGRSALFESRLTGGHIVDGHGDLQAADIFCLDDGPRILDCIEFADRFRFGDVIADVAFLAMDLERLGAPDLAGAFLDQYGELSGERCPRSLVEMYLAYRAHVRAKVNCLRAAQSEGAERDEAMREANRLLHTAARWLAAARVRLVLVGGAPGTGKTTIARAIGAAQGWPVLSSDAVRDELFVRGGPEELGQGRYADDARDAVYRELLERARVALSMGETVVLDATWGSEDLRAAARAVGEQCVAEVVELRCETSADVAARRVTERLAAGSDASEATARVAQSLAASFDPWPEAVSLDTSVDVAVSTAAALDAAAT